MRKRIRTLLHIFSFLIVFAAVFAAGRQNAVAYAADRMYVFNMGFDGMQGNLILVESDGQWGLLDAGHRNANTIQDSNGRIISVSEKDQYSNRVSMRNGKDVARYMVNVLGVTHLDFIVGTHSHMDHIGGVPEIATTGFYDADGSYRYLVDDRTTYFYKEYQHIADFEDDLERYSELSWHNQAYYYQATKTMQDQGATLVDVSKQQVIHGDPGNAYGDYVTFTMGNMSFRLYNVYEQTNTGNENVNSIVTVMTNGDYTVVNLSDINTGNAAIDQTSRAIGKNFGEVDVVVAGHHGYAGSNTKVMFDELQPDFVLISNDSAHGSWLYTSCDLAAAMPYARGLFGTSFFSTALSPYAIVTDLSGDQVYVYNLEYDGDLTDAFYKVIRKTNQTGWVSWINTDETLWAYLENGDAKRNAWQACGGNWYYLGEDGLMQTGWVDGGRYFCGGDGAMATGWLQLDGSWYFFEGSGVKAADGWKNINGNWYYFDPEGVMQTGWVDDGRNYCREGGAMAHDSWENIDGAWYYFESNGAKTADGWKNLNGNWYYFDPEGVMQTGWVDGGRNYCREGGAMAHDSWENIDGVWYYFESNGAKAADGWKNLNGNWYYFDPGGVMQTGWVDGGRNYCREGGAMAHDCWENIEGAWYYFEGNGVKAADGWKNLNGNWYYLDPEGVMLTGWLGIDGNTYYLLPGGEMATGWQKIDGKEYYFDAGGIMARDTVIDGYTVGTDGAWIP